MIEFSDQLSQYNWYVTLATKVLTLILLYFKLVSN